MFDVQEFDNQLVFKYTNSRGDFMDKNKQDLKYALVRMSNVLVTKSTKMDAEYQKLFYIALASIIPTQSSNEIIINKSEIFDLLGLKSENKHTRLRQMFIKLMHKSLIQFGEDDEEYVDGFLINKVRTTRKDVIVRFDEDYMPLLAQLSTNYTRLLNDDLIHFESKFSMMLYQFLMKNNNNVKTKNPITLTTRQLKQLFGLSETDYCRKNGKFDRNNFEMYTLNIAIKEINEKAKCIHNLQYVKHYKHRLVTHYEFIYSTSDPQKIADKMKDDDIIEGQLSFDLNNPNNLKEKNEHEISTYEWWDED